MRDTKYATELARVSIDFPSGTQGRIERLRNKERNQIEIRFSWWKDNRMVPRPLDMTEEEFLSLFENALEEGIFSDITIKELRRIMSALPL